MITLQLPWACCSLLIGLLSACTRGVDSPDPRLVAMRKAITEVTSNAWKTVSDCPGAVGSLSLSYDDLQLLSAALQRYTDDEILSFVEWPIISDLNDLKAEISRNLELRLCEIEELRANRDLSADKDELLSDEYDSLLESKMIYQEQNTVCCVCGDDYGDIAEECFIANACPDCRDTDYLEELLEPRASLPAPDIKKSGELNKRKILCNL
jgi:hypothetical protein